MLTGQRVALSHKTRPVFDKMPLTDSRKSVDYLTLAYVLNVRLVFWFLAKGLAYIWTQLCLNVFLAGLHSRIEKGKSTDETKKRYMLENVNSDT